MDLRTIVNWGDLGLFAAAAALATVIAGLVIWTLLPVVAGWQPSVIVSGSMTPNVRVGDVVVTSPVDVGKLRKHNVIRFADPAFPGRHLMHRIVATHPDGTITTRGDANQQADSTPVPAANVEGLARLRIPYVGLPQVWLQNGSYAQLAMVSGTLLLTIFVLSMGGSSTSGDPAGSAKAGTAEIIRRTINRHR
jgi:signal peptidase